MYENHQLEDIVFELVFDNAMLKSTVKELQLMVKERDDKINELTKNK